MRKIFFIYWIWYTLTLIFLISEIQTGIEVARIIGVSMIINLCFIAFAPIYYLIYFRKSHSSDQKYLNACLYSGVIRCTLWCFAFYGLNNHAYILALNGLGMLVFMLMERKLKRISQSYFEM